MPRFAANSKKEEGRSRKIASKEKIKQEKVAREQERLDREWSIGAQDTLRKQAEEAKRLEKISKKKEREALEAIENAELEKISARSQPKKQPAARLSVSSSKAATSLQESEYQLSDPSGPESFVATNTEDAVFLLEASTYSAGFLSTSGQQIASIDKHPEKRVKAAYATYEEENLPLLKESNPTLRLSQLRQILQKAWKKAPENPHNQGHSHYNSTRDEEEQLRQKLIDEQLERLRLQ